MEWRDMQQASDMSSEQRVRTSRRSGVRKMQWFWLCVELEQLLACLLVLLACFQL